MFSAHGGLFCRPTRPGHCAHSPRSRQSLGPRAVGPWSLQDVGWSWRRERRRLRPLSRAPWATRANTEPLGEHGLDCPPAGTTGTSCLSSFTSRGPGNEHGTNEPPPTGRARGRPKETPRPPTSQSPPLWHPPWPSTAWPRADWVRMTGQDNLEANPTTRKPETASHAAEQLCWAH